jgi:glucose/arabinose dehydrogenase
MLFDQDGLFYVQLGSGSNVDPNSKQARIHRWNITSIPAGGFPWDTGQVFADGLRNEVGLRMDKEGRIWGVENGIDNLFRQSLGGDIHNTNPSEELNLFLPSTPGMFYGYPYCWSTFNLSVAPPGTQWVTNQFLNDGIHTDAWCQNRANVVVPKLNLPAHYAPLDLYFYYKGANGTFPAEYEGHAFVSCHGSWDRQPPAGYKVLHVGFAAGVPTGYEPFLEYEGPGEVGPNWPHRPVGLGMTDCGPAGTCLLVSSDSSGAIIAVARQH